MADRTIFDSKLDEFPSGQSAAIVAMHESLIRDGGSYMLNEWTADNADDPPVLVLLRTDDPASPTARTDFAKTVAEALPLLADVFDAIIEATAAEDCPTP